MNVPCFFVEFFRGAFSTSVVTTFTLKPGTLVPTSYVTSAVPSTDKSSKTAGAESVTLSFTGLAVFSLSVAPVLADSTSLRVPPLPKTRWDFIRLKLSEDFLVGTYSLPPRPVVGVFVVTPLSIVRGAGAHG